VSMNQARFGLLGIFIFSLAVHLAAFAAVSGKMWPDEFDALVLKVLSIYSVHLTVILGAIFAQPKGPLEDPPAPLAWTAIGLALLWNLLLLWRSVYFSLATQDSVTDLIKYLDQIGSSSSFLVAGATVFFFGKGTARGRAGSKRPANRVRGPQTGEG
jgi:hypothetical protein